MGNSCRFLTVALYMRDNEPAFINNSWQGQGVVQIYEMKDSSNQFMADMWSFPQFQASFPMRKHKYP